MGCLPAMRERRRRGAEAERGRGLMQPNQQRPVVPWPRTHATAATAALVEASCKGEAGETNRWGGATRTEEGGGGVGWA